MRQVVEHVTASNRTARNGRPQTRQNLDFIGICYTCEREPGPSRGRLSLQAQALFATGTGTSGPLAGFREWKKAQVKAWTISKSMTWSGQQDHQKCHRIPTIPVAAAAVSSTKCLSWPVTEPPRYWNRIRTAPVCEQCLTPEEREIAIGQGWVGCRGFYRIMAPFSSSIGP
jgi:hypothetical protein